jgi:hypothetical protein
MQYAFKKKLQTRIIGLILVTLFADASSSSWSAGVSHHGADGYDNDSSFDPSAPSFDDDSERNFVFLKETEGYRNAKSSPPSFTQQCLCFGSVCMPRHFMNSIQQ